MPQLDTPQHRDGGVIRERVVTSRRVRDQQEWKSRAVPDGVRRYGEHAALDMGQAQRRASFGPSKLCHPPRHQGFRMDHAHIPNIATARTAICQVRPGRSIRVRKDFFRIL